MQQKHENLLDEFVDNLDFDNLLKWLDLMNIDNEPPPTDDMYPDWEGAKKGELMESLCNLFDLPIGKIQLSLSNSKRLIKDLTRRVESHMRINAEQIFPQPPPSAQEKKNAS